MQSLTYADADRTTIVAALDDGSTVFSSATGPVAARLASTVGAAPADYAPPPPTTADVQAERARRLALGFDFDFGDARGIHRIGTTPADLAGWREVTDLAAALIASGNPTMPMTIVTDSGPTEVTALEWQSVLLAAAAFRQPIWQSSFVLQAMNPIPADYAADIWWLGSA